MDPRRAGARVLARKAVARLAWSRRAVALACEPGRRAVAPRADVPLSLELAGDRFAGLVELQERLAGAEYLHVRGLERTRRAGAGDLVVARTADGRLAGVHFLHFARHGPALDRVAPGLYPPLRPTEALTEGLYVVPELRGAGVAPALLAASVRFLGVLGCTRALAYVDTRNVASLRAFARAGYRPAGDSRDDRYVLGRWSTRFRELERGSLEHWWRGVAAEAP